MKSHNPIPFLRTVELFSRLNEEELRGLLPFIQVFSFKTGDWIIHEGEQGRELLIIKSGIAQALKEEVESGEYQDLGSLKSGDYFGEMAHLENQKRSASIRAIEPMEIIALDLDALQNAPDKEKTYAKITVYLAKSVSQRLRKTDDLLIDYLKEKLRITQSFTQITKTLVQIFIFMALWFNLSKFIGFFPLQKPILDPLLTIVLGVFFSCSAIYVIKTSGYPLSFYGLTLNKFFVYTIEGFFYSLPMIAFFFVLKWFLIHHVDLFKEVPLFSLSAMKANSHHILVFGGLYIISIPIQEFIARGCLQSSFRNFFQGPGRVFSSILVSNLLFQMVHTVKGFWLAFFSFFLGIFWGILFEKQKSIVGPIVSHIVVGFICLFILDYETLFLMVADQ